MVTLLAPFVSKSPTYVKVANFPCLYRHNRSGRYYACKKVSGRRKEYSLETCDRKIAERRLKEWVGNLEKVDAEVEKTTISQLVERYLKVTAGLSESSRANDKSVIKKFWAWWPHGKNFQVRQVRPSMLDEWLVFAAGNLRNVTYNGYAAFVRQLFDIAVKDRIIAESPAKSLRVPWKKPQTPVRIVPTVAQFEAIVESIRSQEFADTAEASGDFIEFLGLAGVGQAEAWSLTWGDIDWRQGRMNFRRHKTDTHFYVPIYAHLRPLLVGMKERLRGRVPASARVFKFKDAKKALTAACKRLNLPHFSQRNLRQSLIRRLIRAKVDVKLISKWQGHQDGGQLIMDTYTEVFGDDDAEYEQGQLAKIGGDQPAVAQFCGEDVDEATSTFMKRSKKKRTPEAPASTATIPAADVQVTPAPAEKDASTIHVEVPPVEPAAASVPATPILAANPYQKGDRVKTKLGGKGEAVEAEVTAVFKDEVQVRTPDGELRWRTIRTVHRLTHLP